MPVIERETRSPKPNDTTPTLTPTVPSPDNPVPTLSERYPEIKLSDEALAEEGKTLIEMVLAAHKLHDSPYAEIRTADGSTLKVFKPSQGIFDAHISLYHNSTFELGIRDVQKEFEEKGPNGQTRRVTKFVPYVEYAERDPNSEEIYGPHYFNSIEAISHIKRKLMQELPARH